ncbi:hypothetical protein DL98DRAFT_593183 [Cadophora sp. DSE1049]|nr:hypothetical protein DL98DRAFT_593183 [Cadophora sp. DSE1049]
MPTLSDISTRSDVELTSRPIVKGKYQKPSTLVHTLKTMKLDELPEIYPPVGCLVAETEEIRSVWEEHLKEALLSDPRSANKTRRQVVMMDFSKMKYTVPEGEYIEIRNAKTNEFVCAVQPNIFGQKTVRNANGGVFDHLNRAKGTRADDPGIMANVGYTAGLRSDPEFAWGKNLIGKSIEKEKLSYKSSCWLAHGWNLAQPYFPEEVVDDYNKVTAAVGGVGMDAGRWSKGKDNTVLRYIVPEGEADYLYETSDLAPPCANFSKNYVKGTHKDSNANKFGSSITTSRLKQMVSLNTRRTI